MQVRLTENEYKRLRAGQQNAKEPNRFKLKAPKLKLSERDVTRQIHDFLTIEKWTVVRQQSGLFRRVHDEGRVRVGEKSMADWYAVRPKATDHRDEWYRPAEFFFFEVKTPGKKPTTGQMEWLAKKRMAGFHADWFDTIDRFNGWYYSRFK